jgi:hypothetical protein
MPEDPDRNQVRDSPEQGTGKKKEDEGEAGKLGLVFALIYGTGLATANVFLAQYGIRDFSILKPKAIFTGAIVLSTIALISSGPMNLISRYIDRHGRGKLSNKNTFVAVALRLLLPFVVLLAFTIAAVLKTEGLIVDRRNFDIIVGGIKQALLYTVGLYLTSCATAIFSIQSIRKFRNIQRATSFSRMANQLSTVSLSLTGAMISLSLYISLFTVNLYESIPPTIGGPGLESVQLQVRKESLSDIQKLGIEFSAENDLLTKPLTVIYESDDQIYVFVPLLKLSPKSPPDSSVLIPSGKIARLPAVEISVLSRVIRLDKKLLSASILSGTDSRRDLR